MNIDYNGFLPGHPAFADDIPPVIKFPERPPHNRALEEVQSLLERMPPVSPVQRLVDDILEKNLQARVYILEHLVKNPGFVATLDDFDVVFDDIQLEADHESLRDTNETRIVITQTARIRRREDMDGDRTSLGGDPGGEARTD